MKISYNWLKQYVETDLSPEKISEILTETGLEVDGFEKIEAVKGGLEGVFVGEVLTCEKHPDADKLKVTTVTVGGEALQIVCGAPNVAAGQKVVVALPGAKLYPSEGEPFEIDCDKYESVLPKCVDLESSYRPTEYEESEIPKFEFPLEIRVDINFDSPNILDISNNDRKIDKYSSSNKVYSLNLFVRRSVVLKPV